MCLSNTIINALVVLRAEQQSVLNKLCLQPACYPSVCDHEYFARQEATNTNMLPQATNTNTLICCLKQPIRICCLKQQIIICCLKQQITICCLKQPIRICCLKQQIHICCLKSARVKSPAIPNLLAGYLQNLSS
jgi:hypothetical protein